MHCSTEWPLLADARHRSRGANGPTADTAKANLRGVQVTLGGAPIPEQGNFIDGWVQAAVEQSIVAAKLEATLFIKPARRQVRVLRLQHDACKTQFEGTGLGMVDQALTDALTAERCADDKIVDVQVSIPVRPALQFAGDFAS